MLKQQFAAFTDQQCTPIQLMMPGDQHERLAESLPICNGLFRIKGGPTSEPGLQTILLCRPFFR